MRYLHLCPWIRATAICIIHGHFALLSGDIHSRRLPCGSCYGSLLRMGGWRCCCRLMLVQGLVWQGLIANWPCSKGFFRGKVGRCSLIPTMKSLLNERLLLLNEFSLVLFAAFQTRFSKFEIGWDRWSKWSLCLGELYNFLDLTLILFVSDTRSRLKFFYRIKILTWEKNFAS